MTTKELLVNPVSERLKLAFNKSGMTQAQLSSATGISAPSISRYLQGEFAPKSATLIKLATALNVSVEYLMGMDSDTQMDCPTDEDDVDCSTKSREMFVTNLRCLMKKTGKSRKEVGNAIGVSYFTISAWCNGRKYPRIEKVDALAKYFNVSVPELVGEVNSNQQSKPSLNDKDDILGIILRLHTDSDFLDTVEKISRLDCEKLNALQHLLEVFEK